MTGIPPMPPGDDFDELADAPPAAPVPYGLVSSAVNAPTVFADGCLFATRLGPMVRLTFVETILEPADVPQGGLKTRHVGTLVIPYNGFDDMLNYLNSIRDTVLLPDVPRMAPDAP